MHGANWTAVRPHAFAVRGRTDSEFHETFAVHVGQGRERGPEAVASGGAPKVAPREESGSEYGRALKASTFREPQENDRRAALRLAAAIGLIRVGPLAHIALAASSGQPSPSRSGKAASERRA